MQTMALARQSGKTNIINRPHYYYYHSAAAAIVVVVVVLGRSLSFAFVVIINSLSVSRERGCVLVIAFAD